MLTYHASKQTHRQAGRSNKAPKMSMDGFPTRDDGRPAPIQMYHPSVKCDSAASTADETTSGKHSFSTSVESQTQSMILKLREARESKSPKEGIMRSPRRGSNDAAFSPSNHSVGGGSLRSPRRSPGGNSFRSLRVGSLRSSSIRIESARSPRRSPRVGNSSSPSKRSGVRSAPVSPQKGITLPPFASQLAESLRSPCQSPRHQSFFGDQSDNPSSKTPREVFNELAKGVAEAKIFDFDVFGDDDSDSEEESDDERNKDDDGSGVKQGDNGILSAMGNPLSLLQWDMLEQRDDEHENARSHKTETREEAVADSKESVAREATTNEQREKHRVRMVNAKGFAKAVRIPSKKLKRFLDRMKRSSKSNKKEDRSDLSKESTVETVPLVKIQSSHPNKSKNKWFRTVLRSKRRSAKGVEKKREKESTQLVSPPNLDTVSKLSSFPEPSLSQDDDSSSGILASLESDEKSVESVSSVVLLWRWLNCTEIEGVAPICSKNDPGGMLVITSSGSRDIVMAYTPVEETEEQDTKLQRIRSEKIAAQEEASNFIEEEIIGLKDESNGCTHTNVDCEQYQANVVEQEDVDEYEELQEPVSSVELDRDLDDLVGQVFHVPGDELIDSLQLTHEETPRTEVTVARSVTDLFQRKSNLSRPVTLLQSFDSVESSSGADELSSASDETETSSSVSTANPSF